MQYEDYDAVGLAELVKTGEASPKELVESAIKRIETLDGTLNAVVWRSFERAREQAEKGVPTELPNAPFHGVPFLVKDLMAQDAGQPCTYSTRLLKDWRAPRDAELVARYKRAGLIILGRTNTPEFGIYGVTEPKLRGATRNPWNPAHTPGGSSGGSSAAVAARYVPAAHGGDGGGSIRIPASHTGLVGLKPTRARNPAGPYAGERWGGFVAEHALTRTVRDSAALLDATHGPDLGAPYQVAPPARSYLEEVALGAHGKNRRLKIAFTAEPLFGSKVHEDNRKALLDAVSLAESLGHTVVEARPQFDREALVKAYFTVVAAGTNSSAKAAADFARKAPHPSDFEPSTWMLKLIGDVLTAGELMAAQHTIHMAHRAIAPFFTDYDVFLTPTAAVPPVKIGSYELSPIQKALVSVLNVAPARPLLMKALDVLGKSALEDTPNTMLFNLTGQPAISLPLYWNDAGLPIGTQWVARFGDEATLFQLAAELEMARPWASRKPSILSA